MFFYLQVHGAKAPVLPAGKRVRSPGFFPAISGIFPRDFGDFPLRFWGFPPAISGILPRDFENFSPRFWVWKFLKCAYRLGAPDAMMMLHTASPVLHEAWPKSSMRCDGRNPAESGGHFGGHDTWSEGTNLRAGSARRAGSTSRLTRTFPLTEGRSRLTAGWSAHCRALRLDRDLAMAC